MSEFKRGDRVVWFNGSELASGIFIDRMSADSKFSHVVFDGRCEMSIIGTAFIRAPRKTVKVMMQDWINPEYIISPGMDFISREAIVDLAPRWIKSGEPYEREFEV
jgi:hypothetical protein